MLDIKIENATIIDGTGKDRYTGSVGVLNGKLIMNPKEQAKEILDAKGQILCPGFIDSHSHTDRYLGSDPEVISLCKISQGITTEIGGQCGSSLFPIPENRKETMKDYLSEDVNEDQLKYLDEFSTFDKYVSFVKRQNLVGNFAFLQGHCSLRAAVMGLDNRKPTASEMEEMKRLLKEAMEKGCMGLSSGLIYVPGVYSDTEELIELCRVIAPYGGIYATHMRSESDHIVEAVKEAIAIAREAGVDLVISHHKVCGVRNWGASEKTLRLVEEGIKGGMQITLDQYPYLASQTGLCQCMPPKYFTKGVRAAMEYLKDPEMREQIKKEMTQVPCSYNSSYQNAGGFGGILVLQSDGEPTAIGYRLDEYARIKGKDPFDAYFDLMIANEGLGTGAFFCMDEKEMERIYLNPNTVVGTDGLNSTNEGAVHPRAFGSFVRAICHFCKEKKLVSLEKAIYKQTFLTASRWKLKGKGILADGMDADMVLFEEEKLKDTADFEHQRSICEGITKVFVGGKVSYEDGHITNAFPGQVILRSGMEIK